MSCGVRVCDGAVVALVDNTLVFCASVNHPFGGGPGHVKLSVIRNAQDCGGEIWLRSAECWGLSGLEALTAQARAHAHHLSPAAMINNVDELIARDCTVIFGAKEWHSTATAALQEFVDLAPRPRRLIVVIAPPMLSSTAHDLKCIGECADLHISDRGITMRRQVSPS
jgi:hypothetical protein